RARPARDRRGVHPGRQESTRRRVLRNAGLFAGRRSPVSSIRGRRAGDPHAFQVGDDQQRQGGSMKERVRHILAVVLEMAEGEVLETLTAEQTSNWDSIRQLNLVMALEEDFGVSFSSEELGSLTSYRAIVDALAQRGVA